MSGASYGHAKSNARRGTVKAVGVALLVLGVVACSSPSPQLSEQVEAEAAPTVDPSASTIDIQAAPLDSSRVKFMISSSLPTPVEVMASVALAGQKPDDVFIGHSERVRLTGPFTEVIIDTSAASEPLPTGEYTAEVNFYPRWGAQNGNPAAQKAPEISAATSITLVGSGENPVAAKRRNELQRWVMNNMGANEVWDQNSFEKRLGKARKGPSTMSHLHDAYYFPDANITFLVNRLKGEVTVWRMGNVAQ